MAHARQQIREAIVGQVTGLTTTGSNVYESRVWPLGEDKLPGLIVYTETEEAEITTLGGPRNSYRNLQVNIEAHVKGGEYDDTIDLIAKEVRTVLDDDQHLGGLTKDLYYAGIQIDLNGEGDKPAAIATISYMAEYQVDDNNAEVLT